jgi:hypothetical protein
MADATKVTAADGSSNPYYLGFSGGGWNAHSSLAGWISGSLDGLAARGQTSDLTTLLSQIDGISANSGGSWFLSHLAYSTPFVAGLEQKASRDQYNSSGYNGQVAALFSGQPSDTTQSVDLSNLIGLLPGRIRSRVLPITKLLSYYDNLIGEVANTDLNWRKVVDRFVYQPLGMLSEFAGKGLDAARQSWASGKDLVITAAAQSAATVLENVGGLMQNKIFSFVTPTNTALPAQGQVTPLFFNSTVSPGSTTPKGSALFSSGDVNLDLTNNKWFADTNSTRKQLPGSLSTSVSIIDATTASSSAMALLASPRTFGASSLTEGLRNSIASLLQDMAPLASVVNGNLSMPSALPAVPSSTSTEARMALHAKQGLTRLADGGYADNTSGAYMVRHIQDTLGTTKPFNLTLFMNSSIDPLTGIKMPVGPASGELSSYWVPGDVAKLFGNFSSSSFQDGSTIAFDGIPLLTPLVPSPRVFDITAWQGEKPEWTYAKGNLDLAYYDLDVKTVDNPAFGVKGGQSGRVQIFVANNKGSFAAPTSPAVLGEYANNFNVVRDAVANQGGFAFINDALGLGLPA